LPTFLFLGETFAAIILALHAL